MKKPILITIGIIILAIVGAGIYIFKILNSPDKKIMIFRNMHHLVNSVSIPHTNNIYTIPQKLNPKALPSTFEYDDETYNVADEIKDTDMTSLIVIKGGKIISENYYRGNKENSLVINMSITKSVTSLLIGIAYEDGKIEDLDDVASKYAPQLKGTAYENIRIQNLLNMASGVQGSQEADDEKINKISRTGSLYELLKTLKKEVNQGEYFRYNSMDTYALGLVLQGATGKLVNDYFKKKLWNKLGAKYDAYLLTDKKDSVWTHGGLVCATIDLAKIGLLMINGGKNYQGEQLISQAWITASTTPDKPYLMGGENNPNYDEEMGYKNKWWIPEERDGDDYSGIGIYGQILYINPSKQTVIASNSAYKEYYEDEDSDYRRIKMFQTITDYNQ